MTVTLEQAIKAGIRFGYKAGHNDTVEACYGDPDQVSDDYASEILQDLLDENTTADGGDSDG
jgi:hypothetical protein